ncbi:MAG: acyl carrier protein phosphodiesterase [Bacteroidota bacterium]
MNYLAHIYLSEDNEEIEVGNFIADAIKGKTYLHFSKEIQVGILLHRQIDSFTDSNAIVKQSKRRLNSQYGHYKGVIIDIFYDHFLAKNWSDYKDIPLLGFSEDFYKTLQSHFDILPRRIQNIMPYMVEYDWLTSYATLEGIEKVLKGMSKRIGEQSQMHLAINDLKNNYPEFENDFTDFFEKLRAFSRQKLIEITNEI